MIKRHHLLFVIGGFILIGALALWPGRWSPSVYANVTLISFTANCLPGQPEVYLEWETGTEFDTVGFFIARSNSATGTFTRISDFISHEGDTVVGAQYNYVDENAVLGNTYWYKLEELTTNQESEFYGPISVVAGVPATDTPTPTSTATATRTPTATATRTPTATPTTKSATTAAPTASSGGSVATPRIVTGATVTPRPTSSGSTTVSTAPAATATALPVVSEPQQPTAATSMPSVVDVAPPTAVPTTADVNVAQAPAPTLAPTDASPAIVAPVVIATEAAPAAAAASSSTSTALILIVAAVLFLGLAVVILRQVRA
jgi:hypothetical protein